MGVFRRKAIAAMVAETHRGGGLKPTLGSFDLVTLGVGAIIGTGIFVLTGVAAAEYAGPALTVSFLISGLAAGLAALVYAELASMVPVAGSAYTYTYASLGEIVAWLIGWNLALEYMVAGGAVAIGWGGYLKNLLGSVGLNLPPALTASPFAGGLVNLLPLIIAAAVTLLAIRGTRQSAAVNRLVVILKVGVIIVFLAIGVFYVDPANWHPFAPFGFTGVMGGAAIIFFAFIGFDAVATAAEEVRDPKKDLPTGIIGSLALSTLLYVAVAAVLTGMVPYTRLDTPSPVAFALLSVGVKWGAGLIALGALSGLTSVLLVVVYAQSRIFLAMARDGLLPPVFARLHTRYGTPYLSIVGVGAVIATISLLLPIGVVAELANIGTLSAFIVVSLGVLILRRTAPDAQRPFKTPLMPWTPVLAAGLAVYLMLNLPWLTWVRFIVWVAAGVIIYYAYGVKNSRLARPEGKNQLPGPEENPAGPDRNWPRFWPAPTRKRR